VSGGFGVNVGGCVPRIIVAVLTVGVVIALVAGVLLGAADVFTRAQASGDACAVLGGVCPVAPRGDSTVDAVAQQNGQAGAQPEHRG
jgi:hypothetical protein